MKKWVMMLLVIMSGLSSCYAVEDEGAPIPLGTYKVKPNKSVEIKTSILHAGNTYDIQCNAWDSSNEDNKVSLELSFGSSHFDAVRVNDEKQESGTSFEIELPHKDTPLEIVGYQNINNVGTLSFTNQDRNDMVRINCTAYPAEK